MAETREEFVHLAKIAQIAERYDEMVHYMHSVIKISGGELSEMERELVKIAYNNVVGSRKATRQVLSAAEEKEVANKSLVREYIGIVEADIGVICGVLIKMFEECSLPTEELKEEYWSNLPEFQGLSLDNMTREQYSFIAELAEKTKRYKDMSSFMEKLLLETTATDSVLTKTELKLLSVPYLHNIRSLSSLSSLLSQTEQSLDKFRAMMSIYRRKIGEELGVLCNHILELVPSAADIEVKSAAEKTELPAQKSQEYGPFLQWVISSNVHKISVIKGLIDSKILLKPWKKSRKFRKEVDDTLLRRGRAELEVCFESSLSHFDNALTEILLVYGKLEDTREKMKKIKRFLISRRSLKPLMIMRTGTIYYKSRTEKRWEKLQLLVDDIICWFEQLTLHATVGILGGCKCLTITSYSDILAAGHLRRYHARAQLGIVSNLELDEMALVIASAFEAGFSPENLVFI
ncbi:hypothetical protein KSS87_014974 [Heliosperma pusillum]|nr:hypothetical protein KSS87_014974 [Heliosperma pusillum]